jgi:BlaI family transcriptional regulator, penicillinase repressor
MAKQPQISDAEWEVMKVLWDNSPLSVSELCQKLAANEWHPKTIRTMVIRLAKKGAVSHKIKEDVYHYFPTVSKEECLRSATHSFVDRLFDGALTPMIAHFASRRTLSPEEKRELKKLLAKK